jgi:hypothetical protein
VTSITEKVRSILGQHGLSESPHLSCRSVREVVTRLSLQQGVKTWDLVKDPKLSASPASSVKDEVTRAVIGHCAPKIRSILDSIDEERRKYQYKSDSAPSPVPPASTSVGGGVAAGGGDGAVLDDLAQRLRSIGLSNDPALLADMSAKLQKDGVNVLEDLQGLSEEDTRASVAALNLKPVQFRKLFKALSDM